MLFRSTHTGPVVPVVTIITADHGRSVVGFVTCGTNPDLVALRINIVASGGLGDDRATAKSRCTCQKAISARLLSLDKFLLFSFKRVLHMHWYLVIVSCICIGNSFFKKAEYDMGLLHKPMRSNPFMRPYYFGLHWYLTKKGVNQI